MVTLVAGKQLGMSSFLYAFCFGEKRNKFEKAVGEVYLFYFFEKAKWYIYKYIKKITWSKALRSDMGSSDSILCWAMSGLLSITSLSSQVRTEMWKIRSCFWEWGERGGKKRSNQRGWTRTTNKNNKNNEIYVFNSFNLQGSMSDPHKGSMSNPQCRPNGSTGLVRQCSGCRGKPCCEQLLWWKIKKLYQYVGSVLTTSTSKSKPTGQFFLPFHRLIDEHAQVPQMNGKPIFKKQIKWSRDVRQRSTMKITLPTAPQLCPTHPLKLFRFLRNFSMTGSMYGCLSGNARDTLRWSVLLMVAPERS